MLREYKFDTQGYFCMPNFHLLTTRRLPPHLEQRVTAEYHLTRWDSRQQSLNDAAQGQDAILCNPAIALNAAAIAALPASIRVIGTFSVGFDHIDVPAARARGIAVVNTPGVLSEATAEFTMLLLLAAARRAGEAERLLRAGKWLGPSPESFQGVQVTGKGLGIFGMGRIGQALAAMARGFDMKIHYRNRNRLPPAQENGATYHADDASFLAQAELLAICAPASPETQGWLDAARIAALPRGAIVVNTARGSLVDDDALIAALRTGHVRAAGLDVFPHEPTVPPAYLSLENVVLTPHVASATDEARQGMADLVLDGIAAVLAGRHPPNQL
jgi:lactate dehydrogenase-like 2-hydroxyacid dehydrogenase